MHQENCVMFSVLQSLNVKAENSLGQLKDDLWGLIIDAIARRTTGSDSLL
jgi:hypothetical protein